MRRLLSAAPLLLIAFAAACSGEKAEQHEMSILKGATLERVGTAPVAEYFEAAGTVRSNRVSVLSSKVVGVVTSVGVREGDSVRAGQLLLTIDDRDAASQYLAARAGVAEASEAINEVDQAIAAARANLDLAASTYERFKLLREKESVSAQEFQEVETRFRAASATHSSLLSKRQQVLAKTDAARAGLAGANTFVSYTKIASPADGVVTARYIDPGNMAAPGTPLLAVEDDRAFRLEVSVDESRVGTIQRGSKVRVAIAALGQESMGTVAAVVPAADPMSRSYIVKLDLDPGVAAQVRSGMFGKAFFAVGEKSAVTIPDSSLVRRGQLTGVHVVDPRTNLTHLRLVKLGKELGGRVEVLAGLDAGEEIVASSAARVDDGMKVER